MVKPDRKEGKMKVKTLLSTFKKVEYILVSESGCELERDYVGDKYYGQSEYEDKKVLSITTVKYCDHIFITIK